MKTKKNILLCLMTLILSFCASPIENELEKEEIVAEEEIVVEEEGKHLFILSGQSNMARLKPEDSFIPAVKKKFGDANVIVVKSANSGQPMRRWYKDWKPFVGNSPSASGDLYDRLMDLVYPAIKNEKIETITFSWMQGEKDANEKHGEVYAKSLIGLHEQLSRDLRRNDVNFIIGRLSDYDLQNIKNPHWTMIREIQVKVAESNIRFDWINTDDLNDGIVRNGVPIENDLHMSTQGYVTMGERFAEKSIELIEKAK